MTALDLLDAIGSAQDEYLQEACFMKKTRSVSKARFFLIAAIIILILLLVGCAAYFYKLEHLVVVDNTGEQTPSLVVSQKVLSMQGYEGSPSNMALREWLAFAVAYTAEHPESRFNETYRRPDDYWNYPCYTQEMVDMVDALCEKYGLHTIGKPIFLWEQSEMEAYGLTGILSREASPRSFYGHVFQDGSFVASGELQLSGEYEMTVQFQMRNIKKDAFYTVPLGINNISDYTQWSYPTQDGYVALLALSSQTGLIFVEGEDRFISVIIEGVPNADMFFEGLPEEKHFLEAVCNLFIFSEPENKAY